MFAEFEPEAANNPRQRRADSLWLPVANDKHTMVVEQAPHAMLLILALSLLVSRVGAVAFEMTGLSPDVASFQATSAFSGAGFTTDEADQITQTPGRRKMAKLLILLGNVGLVSALAVLVISFSNGTGTGSTVVYIVGGSTVIILVSHSAWLNRIATPVIKRTLSRTTNLEIKDYVQLLGLQSDYRISEITVHESDWLANATPDDLELADEGVLLLGIQCNGTYIGAPDGETEIKPEDTVVLYGKQDRLWDLSGRDSGDVSAHDDAVTEHEETLEEQDQLLGR